LALAAESGEVIWKYDTASEGLRSTFHADPVIAGEVVLTAADGSPDSHLYAFEAASGRLRWKRPVPPRGISTALVADSDTVFAVSSAGQVLALAVSDGSLRWSFDLPAGPGDRRGRPLLAAGQLVVVEPEGSLFAFEAKSGRELWRQALGEPIHPAVQSSGGLLSVVSGTGELFRLAAKTGQVEFRSPLAPGPAFGAFVPADPCWIALIAPRTVVCADPETGRARWTFRAGADLSTFQALHYGDVVWIGDESGRLTALSLSDGAEARFLRVPGVPRGLAVAGSRLIVGTLEGSVVAFENP
jgi:outer membrane protein assembly factor BamB